MTGFNHTLAGCIIAVIVPAPLAPIAAFLSHFFLDATPHFGRHRKTYPYTPEFKRLLIVDAVLCFTSLGFALWLFPHLWWLLIICSFTSTLPDFMWLLKGRVRWLKGFFHFASVIQWGERPYGWIFELLYTLFFVAILLRLA